MHSHVPHPTPYTLHPAHYKRDGVKSQERKDLEGRMRIRLKIIIAIRDESPKGTPISPHPTPFIC